MHYAKLAIFALIGLATAAQMPNGGGDDTSTSCSVSQSTICCDKSGKNCETKDSCSNDAMQICGNTISVPVSLCIRTDRNGDNGGDDTTTSCSVTQSTVCCDSSGKNCEVKDSCNNDAVQICGNTVSVPVPITARTDRGDNDDDEGGDDTQTSCGVNQSTMCCDKSGKNCSVQDSCSNDALQICGNTITVSVTVDASDILRRLR